MDNDTKTYINIGESLATCCLACCQHRPTYEIDFPSVATAKDFKELDPFIF